MTDQEHLEIEHLAKQACQYAREQILEGSSQLVNQYYTANKRAALSQAVTDIRKAIDEPSLYAATDFSFRRFEQCISKCKKFSIGNCGELAFMALDYMIRHRPDIRAEYCEIVNGDHAFLVIGRDINSNPNDPATWGESAYMCDPWANEVYPMKDYLQHLKFYSGMSDHYTVSFFDKRIHRFQISSTWNNVTILSTSANQNKLLLEACKQMIPRFLAVFNQLVTDLEQIITPLSIKYSKNDAKLKILTEKVNVLKTKIQKLSTDLNKVTTDFSTSIEQHAANRTYKSYHEMQQEFEQTLKSGLRSVGNASILTSDERDAMALYRNKYTLKTFLMKLLGIQPKSLQKFQVALQSAQKELSTQITRGY